jgi:hypothetical protein
MKEKEKYNINDFWPQADEMLNKHFRQKRLFRLLGASIFTVAVAIGLFILNNKNENKNHTSLNSNKNNNSVVSNLNSTTKEKSKDLRNQESNSIANNTDEVVKTGNKNLANAEIDYAVEHTSNEKINPKNTKNITRQKSDLKNRRNSIINTFVPSIASRAKNISQLKKIEPKVYPEIGGLSNEKDSNKSSQIKATNEAQLGNLSKAELSDPRNINELKLSYLNSVESSPMPISYTTNESIQKQELKNSFLKNKKMFWAIFAHIGYFNTSKNINTSGDLSAYTLRRTEEEKSNFVLNYGTGIKLWYKKFAVNIGVDYSSYSESVNYQNWKNGYTYNQKEIYNIFYTPLTNVDTSYYQGIQYQNPTTTLVRDSTKTILTDSVYGRINNEGANQFNGKTLLSYAEFPIIAEYNFVFNKFSIGLNAGISPGLATYRKGYYISKNQESFENINSNTEFRRWIWNARAGVNINYRISNGLEIYLQPQYRTNLNSVFNSSSGIKQKYTSVGTSLGLLFWF